MIKKKLAGAVLAVAAAGLFALAPAVSTAMDDNGKPMNQSQNGCGSKHKHRWHHKKHGCHTKHRDDNKQNSEQKMAPGDDKAADNGNK